MLVYRMVDRHVAEVMVLVLVLFRTTTTKSQKIERRLTTDNDDSIMLVPQFIIKSFERTL